MKGKRGQGLSTSAIVLIVLAVVVLVVLVLGFTMGWERIAPWISSDSNLGTIEASCNVACSTNSAYDYCVKERNLVIDGEEVDVPNTKYTVDSCFVISQQAQYGLDECPALTSECPGLLKAAGKETTS